MTSILILGGTTEASEFARLVAADGRWSATLSLAGRTRAPVPQPIPVRIGGFGGAEGLAAYLRAHRVDALIDATHPFAAQISRNAAAAAEQTGTKLLTICRPAWRAQDGDRWQPVATMTEAAEALGPAPRRVLLTIGQQDLLAFIATPQHSYTVRSVDPPARLPNRAVLLIARGPFAEPDERRLLAEHRIEILVTKNSGGVATEAKLHAARALGLPVIMVARPALPGGCATAAEAFASLCAHAGTERGE